MCIPVLTLALLVALLVMPAHSAQTPAMTQASGALKHVTVENLTPGRTATTGIIRMIYPTGATLQRDTGSGPSVHFVESGTVTLSTGNGPPPLVVRAGAANMVSTSKKTATPEGVAVGAGDGFLLASDTTFTLRNDGPDPAAVLDLLTAPDASADSGKDVNREILVRQEVTLPELPVSVTLSRITLEPGDRVSIADAPALTFYTAVERSQGFSLSG